MLMKKYIIFPIILSLIAMLLPAYCFADSSDVYTTDGTSDNSYITDNPTLSDAAGSESDLLASIKSNPALTSDYQSLADLYASENVSGYKVFVDGSAIDFSQYDNVQPIIVSGRTLIPVRAVAEALGADVEWDQFSGNITITLDSTSVELTVNSASASINGSASTLDVPAESVDGRTLVPLRFVGTAFGEQVGWYASGNVGIIALYN